MTAEQVILRFLANNGGPIALPDMAARIAGVLRHAGLLKETANAE